MSRLRAWTPRARTGSWSWGIRGDEDVSTYTKYRNGVVIDLVVEITSRDPREGRLPGIKFG